jgi:hypothetical protein
VTTKDVLALLEKNKNERGIAHWARLFPHAKLTSFGIGLTQLRKLAKQVGRDHDLALELWKSTAYDAKVVGVLIDDPKQMTRLQAESQVRDLGAGLFSHVYCSCGAPLTKAPFARELAVDWMNEEDALRRRCGYPLLGELAKDKKDTALTGAFFAVGQRNAPLNKKAIALAKAYAPLHVDYGDNSCLPVDVVRHLTSDRMKKAFG